MIPGMGNVSVALLTGLEAVQLGFPVSGPGLAQLPWGIGFACVGCAILVVALARLLPRREQIVDLSHLIRRCPVCDLVLYREGKYCPECGSQL